MKSTFLKINIQDVARGVIVAAGAAFLAGVVPILESGQLPTIGALQGIGITGLAAGAAYLAKNFLTNSREELGRGENG